MRKQLVLTIFIYIILLFSLLSHAAGIPESAGEDNPSVSEVIFFGDSRVVGMYNACQGDIFIGKEGAGYSWMAGEGYTLLQEQMSIYPDADVVFCFGVNDTENISSYISSFFAFCDSHPDQRSWFMSVNPVIEEAASANGYHRTNAQIDSFNAQMSCAFPDRYLDVASELALYGYASTDGIHYDENTYVLIQSIAKLQILLHQ